MSIAHIGGGDADDDKPDDPFEPKGPLVYDTPFTVQEYGLAVEVSSELVDEFGGWERTIGRECRRIQDWLVLSTLHSIHGPWSPADPQCVLCSWGARIWAFWGAVESWGSAHTEATRPRCVETRDGSVSVIHHVEPCTCHEGCGEDEDY